MRPNEQIYSKKHASRAQPPETADHGNGIGGQRHKPHASEERGDQPWIHYLPQHRSQGAAALRVLYKHPAIQVREEIDGVGHGQGHHQRDHGHCDVIEREAEQAIQAQSRQDPSSEYRCPPGTTAARCGKMHQIVSHTQRKDSGQNLTTSAIMDLARLTLVIGQPATWKVWPPAWYCARPPRPP